MRYYLDQSEAQIAETLGCSAGTVKSTASRALTRLRRELASEPHQRPVEKGAR
jgi:DNA-directed RNA polymerase specialized sigma24 family protein